MMDHASGSPQSGFVRASQWARASFGPPAFAVTPHSGVIGRLVLVAIGLAAAAGIVVELWTLTLVRYPGDADPGYYFNVARNIVDGRGPIADTLWFFGFDSQTISHWGGAYWKPLGPFLAAAGMKLVGPTIFGAILPNYVLLWALSAFAALAARLVSTDLQIEPRSRQVIMVATFFSCLFLDWNMRVVVDVVPTMLYTLLGFCTLDLVRRLDLRTMPVAGLLAALACLSRNDGLFLVPVVGLFLLASDLTWRARAVAFSAFLAGLVPPLAAERSVALLYGLPSTNPLKILWMTSFDDLYLLPQDLTPAHLLDMSPMQAVIDRGKAIGLNARRIFENLGVLFTVMAVVGFTSRSARTAQGPHGNERYGIAGSPRGAEHGGGSTDARGGARDLARICLIYLAVEFVMNSVVLPYTGMEGSFRTSIGVVFPVAIAYAFVGLHGLTANPRAFAMLAAVVTFNVAVPMLIDLSRTVRVIDPPKMTHDANIGLAVERLAAQDHIPKPKIVVLGRINSGDFSVATGLRQVYIPSGGNAAIDAIIDRYRPTYLVLDGTEGVLGDIYFGRTVDPRFTPAGPVDGTTARAYRIRRFSAEDAPGTPSGKELGHLSPR